MPVSIIIALAALAGGLALVAGFRPNLTRSREGKILAFVALAILPILSLWGGYTEHMERATSTSFCLSCHVMEDFGRSLHADDPSFIPAKHYQNRLVPRDHACYTCHTTYTMFGTVNAKLKGLRHIQVQYFGTVPKPAEIKLYEPYNNRECLHCHLGARKFESASAHNRSAELLPAMKSGAKSCMSSNCHDVTHEIGSLKDVPVWKGDGQ